MKKFKHNGHDFLFIKLNYGKKYFYCKICDIVVYFDGKHMMLSNLTKNINLLIISRYLRNYLNCDEVIIKDIL